MKKKNSFMHVGSVSSPYKTSDKESMDDWYTSYLMDGAGSIEEKRIRLLPGDLNSFAVCGTWGVHFVLC